MSRPKRPQPLPSSSSLSIGGDLDADDVNGWDRRDWGMVGALFITCVVLVRLHIREYPKLSPIDELAHVDYVLKAGDLNPPAKRGRIGLDAMAEAECRTVEFPV